MVRAYDRIHALALVKEGVDFQVRETLESALAFGEAALREAGVPADEAEEAMADVRRRDAERFELKWPAACSPAVPAVRQHEQPGRRPERPTGPGGAGQSRGRAQHVRVTSIRGIYVKRSLHLFSLHFTRKPRLLS